VAHLRHGAIAVIAQALSDDGSAIGTISLVHHFLQVIGAFELSRAPLDGAFDIILGHVSLSGLVEHQTQAKVGLRVGSPLASGDHNLVAELGE